MSKYKEMCQNTRKHGTNILYVLYALAYGQMVHDL